MKAAFALGLALLFSFPGSLLAADAGVDGGRSDAGGPVPDVALPSAPYAPPPAGGAAPGGVSPASAPAAPASATPPTPVTLRVLARGTRDAVLGASIVLDSLGVGESDENGAFELALGPGVHRLQIQAPGFELYETKLGPDPVASPLTVRLTPRTSGERYQTVVSAPGGGVALAGDELTDTAGSMGEPFRIVESLPGVNQVAWPLTLYSIRGANPGNTGFFIDGVRLPTLFHLGLGPAVIHPYLLERMDFYPGGYPARYGRFVSGVVAASTAPPKTDRLRGSADLRLTDAGGIVALPVNGGRGTLMLGGRYSYTGLIFSTLSPNYTLSYWDYQARFDHALGPGRFTAFAFGSHDQIGHKQYAETDARIDFHRVDLRWQGLLGPGRLAIGSSFGVDESSVSLDPVIKLPISIDTLTMAPRLSYTIVRRVFDVEAGLDGELQRLDPRSSRPDADPDKPSLFQRRVAAAAGGYTSLTLRPIEDIELTAAMRYDVFLERESRRDARGQRPLRARWEPGPRLSARMRPLPKTWVKAQIGRFAQTASLPVAVPGFESFGLAAFGTQTSKQGSLGVEQGLGEALSLDLTGYYQRFRLTDLMSLFQYDPNDPRLLELRDGEGYGVEVMLRRPPSHRFFGWLSYTWSRSLRLVGSSQAKAFSDWDQRHVLNLVLGLRLPKAFSIGGRFHYNTGRPYPLFDDENNASPPDYIRLPAFHQIDLRVEKRFFFDEFVLDVYLEAVNATLSRQVFDVKRVMGEVEERFYEIPLPSLGLHAEW